MSGENLNSKGKYREMDYDEFIFRDRNKAYGGYQLRRKYPAFLGFSLAGGLAFVLLLFVLPFFLRDQPDPDEGKLRIKPGKVVNYSALSAPPPIEVEMPDIPQVMPAEMPKVKTVKFLPPTVKPDEEVEEEEFIPTQEELAKTNIGKENVDGVDSLVNYIPAAVQRDTFVPPPPKKETPPPPPPPKEEEVFLFTEKLPEFPGGERALRDFIHANVVYPTLAKEAELEARILLEFVVEKDGRISNVRIRKGMGHGFDKEAMRIGNMMPDWTPGEIGGKAVRTRMVIPLNFILKK